MVLDKMDSLVVLVVVDPIQVVHDPVEIDNHHTVPPLLQIKDILVVLVALMLQSMVVVEEEVLAALEQMVIALPEEMGVLVKEAQSQDQYILSELLVLDHQLVVGWQVVALVVVIKHLELVAQQGQEVEVQ